MRRVLLASLMVALSLAWMTAAPEPAGATANAGPWDIKVAWRDDATTAFLWIEMRASFDSDDDVNGRYVGCVWYTRAANSSGGGPNVTTWKQVPLDTKVGFPDELVGDELNTTAAVAADRDPYLVFDASVQLFSTYDGCQNTAHDMPIRGRGGATKAPVGNVIEDTDGNAPTDPSTPLPAGVNPPSALPTTDAACTRVLSQNNGANVANFDGVMEPVTGITDTYSWDFGDGSTDATTLDAQHVYPAISSMPEGGWTATLTITRTGDGVLFNEGPSEETCALRVDYLNPEQSEAGSADLDEPEDSDCPTGFGWLNPLAILKVLKCLFIPSEESVDNLGELWGDVTTKAPFSWAYEVVTLPGAFFGAMHDEAEDQYEADGGGTVCTNLVGGAVPGGAEVTNCEIANTLDGSAGYIALRTVVVGLFLIALALGIYQTVVWTVS